MRTDIPNDPIYLYVISDADRPGIVKIGYAADPHSRVRKLQTGNAGTLVLHHAEQVPRSFARALEKSLHRDMHHRHVKGEWYRMTVTEAVDQVQFTLIRYIGELEEEAAFASELATFTT